jgi:hypothetical protein
MKMRPVEEPQWPQRTCVAERKLRARTRYIRIGKQHFSHVEHIFPRLGLRNRDVGGTIKILLQSIDLEGGTVGVWHGQNKDVVNGNLARDKGKVTR